LATVGAHLEAEVAVMMLKSVDWAAIYGQEKRERVC
jgi:hypothetical protein